MTESMWKFSELLLFMEMSIALLLLYLPIFITLILSNKLFLCIVEIMNDASSGMIMNPVPNHKKRNEIILRLYHLLF